MSPRSYEELRALFLLVASFTAVWAVAMMAARPYQWLARARHFLSVLDTSRIRGVAPEGVLLKLADMGATDMGLRLHLLACWLRQGLKLGEALPRVRRFLPRSVQALVLYGLAQGRLPEVLPVAQKELQELAENPTNHRHDLFSVVGMALGVLMIGCLLFLYVLPKYAAIMSDMTGNVPWVLTELMRYQDVCLNVHLAMIGLMLLSYRFVLAGPAARTWLECKRPSFADRVQGRFSFQRLLYQQRFGRVLARLLDVGVAEDEALVVAGTVTSSSQFRKQAEKAVGELRGGAGLMPALKNMDLDEDFYFRLKAARDSGKPLAEALEDWQEAVKARAEFRERVVVNLVGTAFIFYNAILICVLGYSFFNLEAQLIEALTLW